MERRRNLFWKLWIEKLYKFKIYIWHCLRRWWWLKSIVIIYHFFKPSSHGDDRGLSGMIADLIGKIEHCSIFQMWSAFILEFYGFYDICEHHLRLLQYICVSTVWDFYNIITSSFYSNFLLLSFSFAIIPDDRGRSLIISGTIAD